MTNNSETNINTENQIVHIGLEFPDDMPDMVIDKITQELNTPGLILDVHKNESFRMFAALEWVIPTTIGAFILKPYFESFLQEAGKDHYQILKGWLKKFVDGGRAIKTYRITASQSTEKNVNKDNQSKSVSLLLQTKNGKIIKLLFDNDLAKEDWDNAIDQLLDYAIHNYEKFPNDYLSQVLSKLEPGIPHHIYAIIDKNSKQLLFYDTKGLVQLSREKTKKNTSNDTSDEKNNC